MAENHLDRDLVEIRPFHRTYPVKHPPKHPNANHLFLTYPFPCSSSIFHTYWRDCGYISFKKSYQAVIPAKFWSREMRKGVKGCPISIYELEIDGIEPYVTE
jgi:hypothetical protein